VVVRDPAHCDTGAAADLLDGPLELGALGQHALAIRRAEVVEVEVHGQPRHVVHEEVEGRSALERHARRQERVLAKRVEQLQQPEHLLEGFERVPALSGGASQLGGREVHGTAPHERSRTSGGTTRFQGFTTCPDSRSVPR